MCNLDNLRVVGALPAVNRISTLINFDFVTNQAPRGLKPVTTTTLWQALVGPCPSDPRPRLAYTGVVGHASSLRQGAVNATTNASAHATQYIYVSKITRAGR